MSKTKFSEDELALLAMIHSTPRDDAPRLVYADWLEENGEPEYAEFIRLQLIKPHVAITLSKLSPSYHIDPFDTEGKEAYERKQHLSGILQIIYQTDRFSELRQLHAHQAFYRGLCMVHNTCYTSPQNPFNWVNECVPPIARLDLYLEGTDYEPWLNHPILHRADQLSIEAMKDGFSFFTEEDIHVLAACPYLQKMCRLNLRGELDEYAMKESRELLEPFIHVDYSF